MSNTEEEWMNRTLDTSLEDTESIDTAKIFIFCLFFVELALTILYMLSANTVYQSQIIAHGICKNFSTWQFMENMTRGAKSGGTREPGSQKVY